VKIKLNDNSNHNAFITANRQEWSTIKANYAEAGCLVQQSVFVLSPKTCLC
jgi:hypothetical protein